ncbi:MAG: HpcH/HpaI aldolase/citrate lyase family protein [Gulosibacter sp.]|uniref:HpcH/HpaI aldolase/citrate lyase family protein n=1 Tax=Gulosibacter sp. TaxID=2817531 RepID=UPI003F8EF80C
MSQQSKDALSDISTTSTANIDRARTALFVPATRPDRIAKAFAAGADAVIVDLEDAVAPEAKAEARATLGEVLSNPGEFGLETAEDARQTLTVRLNSPLSDEGARDREWLASGVLDSGGLDSVLIAKAESSQEVDLVAQALGASATTILPLVESPAGVVAAQELAAHPRVSRLALGAIDLALELGCEPRSTTVDYVRAQLVIASALAGKQGPLDSPSPEFKDDELVRSDTEHAKRSGCTGKLCIHPRQVVIVADVFAPSDEELDWARRVLEVGTLGQVDGQMVDRPVILRAQRILGV